MIGTYGSVQRNYTEAQQRRDIRRHQERRRAAIDTSAPRNGKPKTERIDLGLAVLCVLAEPRACFTCDEIARFAGCTDSAIHQIEHRALRKVRKAARFKLRLFDELTITPRRPHAA